MKTTRLIAIAVLVIAPLSAYAQTSASVSSKRMQADVQRNNNQQARIQQGVQSGQLTNREANSLERGQAKVERREARAEANGHVSAREQAGIQAAENRQSARIYNQKHDAQVK